MIAAAGWTDANSKLQPTVSVSAGSPTEPSSPEEKGPPIRV